MRRRTIAFLIAAMWPLALCASGTAAPVEGRVASPAGPVAGALVVVFDLATRTARTVETGIDGVFRLADLPSGLYRIVVVKAGFAPITIPRYQRGNGPTRIDLELAEEVRRAASAPSSAASVWRLRELIAPDPLREQTTLARIESPRDPVLSGRVRALSGAAIGSRGELSTTHLDVGGALPGGARWDLEAGWDDAPGVIAAWKRETQNLRLDVDAGETHSFSWASRRTNYHDDSATAPFDVDQLESHRVSWESQRPDGERTEVMARLAESLSNSPRSTSSDRLVELGATFRSAARNESGLEFALQVRQLESQSPMLPIERAVRAADGAAGGRIRAGDRFLFDGRVRGSWDELGWSVVPEAGVAYQVPGFGALRVFAYARHRDSASLAFPDTLLEEEDALARSEDRGWGVVISSAESLPGTFAIELRTRELDQAAFLRFGDEPMWGREEIAVPAGARLDEATVSGTGSFGVIRTAAEFRYRHANAASSPALRIVEGEISATITNSQTTLRLTRNRRQQGFDDFESTELELGQVLPLPSNWPARLRVLAEAELAEGTAWAFDQDRSGRLNDRRWLGGLQLEF